ncbi:MAG: hypothetical protein L6408_03265, partial [Nanoarchaeota archaeon]|nr:hypothetical protein [Nanoarchaeota archaeon]
MIKKCIPKGKLTPESKPGGCEFCSREHKGYNLQGVRVCDEHKNMMMILKCPICGLDTAIHVGAFHGQRFWCVIHEGFHGYELRKESRFDENGNVKPYWSEENIKKRRAKAQRLNDEFYGTTTEEFKLVNLTIDYLDRIEDINDCSEFDGNFKGKE